MKRMIALLSMMLLLLGLLAGSALAQGNGGGAADRQSKNVYWFDEDGEPTTDVAGDARLVRTDSGVSYNLRTTGLTKGDATSIWWVIFNNPEACSDGVCMLPDLFNPAVAASVQSGGGNVVGGSGNSTYASHLNVGQITNPHPVLHGPDFFNLPNPGLTNPRGAEIHLVVRSHGPVIPGMNHGMFNSFEVGCTPGSSGGAGDGGNECADLQFTVFLPPDNS